MLNTTMRRSLVNLDETSLMLGNLKVASALGGPPKGLRSQIV